MTIDLRGLSRGRKAGVFLFFCVATAGWGAIASRYSLWIVVPLSLWFGYALGDVIRFVFGREQPLPQKQEET
jgi:hypothetical protein